MFKCVKMLNKEIIKSFLLFIVTISVMIWFFAVPEYALNGAKFGMNLCFNTLIPSVFPFMVLSSLIVNLGLCERLSYIFEPITKFLFKLPGAAGTTILFGLVGGYPTGACGTMALLKNGLITRQQAERMAYFVVGAGPSFAINVVGSQLLQNEKLGVILLISQFISSILIGIGIALFSDKEVSNTKSKQKEISHSFSQGLISSTANAADNIINMCAFVVLFSSFLEIIKNSKINIYLEQLFLNLGIKKDICQLIMPIFLEVTNGMTKAVSCHAPIFLLSFAIAWAGICVHLQIFYCLKDLKFSKIKFMLFRFLQGIISGLIANVLVCFFAYTVQVSTIKIHTSGSSFFSVAPSSFALVLLCVCFLSTLTPKNISFDIKKTMRKSHQVKSCERIV